MPRKIKFKKDAVTPLENDEGFEVTLPDDVFTEDDVKKNFVSKDDHDTALTKARNATEFAKRKAREEAIEDEGFLNEVAKKKADFFKERFGGSGDDKDVQAQLDAVRKDEVQPLKERLDGLSAENESLRKSAKSGAVERAMSDSKVVAKRRLLVNEYIERRTQWDPKTGSVVVVDDEGTVRKRSADGGMRAMSTADLLEEMRAMEEFDDCFEADERDGSSKNGDGGDDSSRRSKKNVGSRADLKTPAEKAAYVREHGHEEYLKLPVKPED